MHYNVGMKRILPVCAAVMLASAPVLGGEGEPTAEEGFSLLEEGAKIILRSFLDEVEPSLKDLQKGLDGAMQDLAPALRDLADMMGDLRNYHAPERLPNGDIIIRRKSPSELAMPAPGPEIEI